MNNNFVFLLTVLFLSSCIESNHVSQNSQSLEASLSGEESLNFGDDSNKVLDEGKYEEEPSFETQVVEDKVNFESDEIDYTAAVLKEDHAPKLDLSCKDNFYLQQKNMAPESFQNPISYFKWSKNGKQLMSHTYSTWNGIKRYFSFLDFANLDSTVSHQKITPGAYPKGDSHCQDLECDQIVEKDNFVFRSSISKKGQTHVSESHYKNMNGNLVSNSYSVEALPFASDIYDRKIGLYSSDKNFYVSYVKGKHLENKLYIHSKINSTWQELKSLDLASNFSKSFQFEKVLIMPDSNDVLALIFEDNVVNGKFVRTSKFVLISEESEWNPKVIFNKNHGYTFNPVINVSPDAKKIFVRMSQFFYSDLLLLTYNESSGEWIDSNLMNKIYQKQGVYGLCSVVHMGGVKEKNTAIWRKNSKTIFFKYYNKIFNIDFEESSHNTKISYIEGKDNCFGFDFALDPLERYLVVTDLNAPFYDSNGRPEHYLGKQFGKVSIFSQEDDTAKWIKRNTFEATSKNHLYFGARLAIHPSGETIAISAPFSLKENPAVYFMRYQGCNASDSEVIEDDNEET